MSNYKLTFQRIALIGTTNLFLQLSAIILLPILTKNLSLEDYGIWVQIGVTLNFLVPLATLGLGAASNRFLSGEKNKEVISRGLSSIFAVIIVALLIISAILFIFSEEISPKVFGGMGAEYYVKLTALLVLTGGFSALMDIYFDTFQQIKKRSFFILVGTLLQIVLVGYSIIAGYGMLGAILSLLGINLILILLKTLAILPQVRPSLPSTSLMRTYLTFSLPLVPALLSSWTFNLSNRYVIGYFLGVASVGIYSAAYNIGGVVAFFYGPISVVLLPTISKLHGEGDIEGIRTQLGYLTKLYIMLAVPSVVGLAVLSKKLLLALTTPNFANAFVIIPLVALATILYNYGSIHGNVLMLHKKTKSFGAISMISAIVNVITTIILVNLFGIIGAAVGTLVTFGLYAIMNYTLSSREFKYNIEWIFVLKCIISSGLMAIAVYIINPMGAVNIIVAVCVGAVIYMLALMLLKGFSRDEIMFLKSCFK